MAARPSEEFGARQHSLLRHWPDTTPHSATDKAFLERRADEAGVLQEHRSGPAVELQAAGALLRQGVPLCERSGCSIRVLRGVHLMQALVEKYQESKNWSPYTRNVKNPRIHHPTATVTENTRAEGVFLLSFSEGGSWTNMSIEQDGLLGIREIRGLIRLS